eukprot:CAMPEP_0195518696 /NCGR_PEP_ID=MMETSP0794_2-20130614/13521_1 /TAXON_ID=515487 /ORGANISM="Stephanopyxis turris, Strain CCMP 815" /LENGTH=611 /DNA_ID=CAMNT_0040647717 /DNA_START=303 /DNA_END=2138 /DNA_ORIENTATION=+
MTAIMDINGGASQKNDGVSMPLEIFSLYDGNTNTYKQKVSYFNGVEQDYNMNGTMYKVIYKDGGSERVCIQSNDEGHNEPMLSFFPKELDFEKYEQNGVVTTEPGLPYVLSTFTVSRGENAVDIVHNEEEEETLGLAKMDYFEFKHDMVTNHPIQWKMNSRNQVFHAHTENWVLNYVHFSPFDGANNAQQKLQMDLFDLEFTNVCEGGHFVQKYSDGGRGNRVNFNRLGLLLPKTSVVDKAAVSPSTTTAGSNFESDRNDNDDEQFELFLSRNGKSYSTHTEKAKRKTIYKNNIRKIAELNESHKGKATFKPNQYLDMEIHEILKFKGGLINKEKRQKQLSASLRGGVGINNNDDAFTYYEVPSNENIIYPDSFDWRTHMPGSVGPIKDQGICGSCWSFSLISSIESHHFIQNQQSVILPEQFVIDCTWAPESNSACDGGEYDVGAKQILHKYAGKIPFQSRYGSYLSIDGKCYMNTDSFVTTNDVPSVTIKDWVKIPPRHDNAVQNALYTQGPLSVSFNVVHAALFYSSGVIDVEECENNSVDYLDHAINLIGWGVREDGKKFWILRNSWSTLWGDDGYFRVMMGERDCGVATDAGFPVVEKLLASATKG